MTDPDLADATYVEPITPEVGEKPDAQWAGKRHSTRQLRLQATAL